MKAQPRVAEVFPPGDFIREELEARGWTQSDLAAILDRPIQAVNEIISGKKAITPETACGLSNAFGTSAEVWLNLENAYRLSRVPAANEDVSRRSRLYSLVPVEELIKRRWIEPSGDLDTLEREVCRFLEIDSVDQDPRLGVAARKSDAYDEFNPVQTAWICRARHIARTVTAAPYDRAKFRSKVADLRGFSVNDEGLRRVPQALADLGVRLVVVEHLPRTKIDGAAFWLDDRSPVVAVSLRFDRIDSFWFTLMHELAHIERDHHAQPYLDENLVGPSAEPGESKTMAEEAADRRASQWLVPPKCLAGFIEGTKPYYSRRKIESFAAEIGVHPGIVVGQLQHRGEVPYSHHRGLLTKVRQTLLEAV